MSCIIPTRPSKPAVSVYILLFHQFIDFNSCALNSNLNSFGTIFVNQNVDLAANELKIVGLEYQSMPNGAVFAGATVSINNTSMQATIRNVAKNAANIMVKNHKSGASSGTVYFTVFYMPKR